MSFSELFRSARALIVALALSAPAVQLGAQQAPESLFTGVSADTTQSQPAAPDSRPFFVRSRTAVLRTSALQRALSAPDTNAFTLNLFDDATFAVTFERTEDSGLGHRTWVGHIANRPLSTVILTLGGDILSGIVRDDTTMFEITSLGGSAHRIDQLDTSAMPRTGDTVLAPDAQVAEELHKGPSPSVPAATPGVDILVYYSTGVRIQVGGTAQAEALAARYVAESNTAYARSSINGQARLLGALEVPAPDGADPQALLPQLRAHPLVQGHRNLGGVDLVALLLTHMQATMPNFIQCGLAYLGPGIDFAFSVTATRSECGAIFAFTHEIGHNLGAQHAPGDPGIFTGPELPSFARGFKALNHSFRTVMAYECTTAPACPPILNFSNPNVLAPPPTPGGQPTGTPSQFNALRVHELFPLVSSYRPGRIPPSAPRNLQGSAVGSTVNLSWTPPAAGGSPADYLIEAGTAPGLSNLVAGLPFGETSLSAPGIPLGTYFLRVRARNAGGVSPPSNEVAIVVR